MLVRDASSIRRCRVTYRAASVIRSSMSPDVHLKKKKKEKVKNRVENMFWVAMILSSSYTRCGDVVVRTETL